MQGWLYGCMVMYQLYLLYNDLHVLLGVLMHKICTNYIMKKFVFVWYILYICTVCPFHRRAISVWP